MAEVPARDSSAAQVIANMQHERIALQKRLTEFQLENQVLRQQLYHVSTLLDIAISKLGTMGVTLEVPIDIRALRADALRAKTRASAGTTQENASLLADSGLPKLTEGSSAQQNKRFQLRNQLYAHTKAIHACAFAPGEESLIASGGLDRRLIVHNFFTSEKVWDTSAHEEAISSIGWFESTRNVLSASYDSTVKLWDLHRTETTPIYQYNTNGFVLATTTLDKSFVFACADVRQCTSIVDVRTHKPVVWEHSSRVNTLAYDPSSAHLILGHSDGTVSIWDIRKAGVALQSAVSVAATAPAEDGLAGTGAVTGATVTHASRSHSAPHSDANTPRLGSFAGGPAGGALSSAHQLLKPELAAAGLEAGPENAGTTAPPAAETPVQWVGSFENESSHAPVLSLVHVHNQDDTKRLLSLSGDSMVRVYRGSLSTSTPSRGSEMYVLRNVLPCAAMRGHNVQPSFWKGQKERSEVSVFLDDGEKDTEQPVQRHLTQCDLAVTGGPDNTAAVYDISDPNSATVLEYLEGHRDRVAATAVHHSSTRPIFATASADSTVRVWVPVKS